MISLWEALERDARLVHREKSNRTSVGGSALHSVEIYRNPKDAWFDMVAKIEAGRPVLWARKNDPTDDLRKIPGSAARELHLDHESGNLLGPGGLVLYDPHAEYPHDDHVSPVALSDALGFLVIEIQSAWLRAFGDLEDDVNDPGRVADDDDLERKKLRKQLCEEVFEILQQRVKEAASKGDIPITKWTGRRPSTEYQAAIAAVLKDLIPSARLPKGPGDWANRIRKKIEELREIELSNTGDLPELDAIVGHLRTAWKPLVS